MKKLFTAVFVCLLSAAGWAATPATITANLRDLTQTAVTSRTVVQATLRGCSSNIPRMIGTGVLVPPSRDYTPDTVTGVVTMSLTKRSDITCGVTAGTTYYSIAIVRDGTVLYRADYDVDADGDLSTMTPRTSAPVVTLPSVFGPRVYVQSFTALSTWTITHGFGDANVVADFYDNSGVRIFPDTFTLTGTNTATATWTTAKTGKAVVMTATNMAIVPSGLSSVVVTNPSANQVISSGTLNVANGFVGNLVGNVTGNVTGNLSGNVTGNLTGSSSGAHTGNVNGVIVVDGVHYTTIATAMAALPAKGGTVFLPNGYRETFTTQYTLGDGINRFVNLVGGDDVTLTCNVTDGTNCFVVSNGSGIVSSKIGRGNTGTNSGFTITYPNTINVANVITSDFNTIGGQGYINLQGFFINGQDSGGTISNAVVNLENVLGQPILRDFVVTHFNNTIGVRVATSTGGVGNTGTGPLELTNVWVGGNHNAGARPLVIKPANSKGLGGISVIGGTYNHPGSGLPMIEVDGGGGSAGLLSSVSINTWVENLANGSSIGVKLRDVVGVNIHNLRCLVMDTDTCIDISESGANKTSAIHIEPFFKSSPTNAATAINNHITGDVVADASIPGYVYGGESLMSPGDFIFSGIPNIRIKDLSNHSLFTFDSSANLTIKNSADAQIALTLDAGSAADQNAVVVFNDRGTAEWSLGKNNSNGFQIRDRVNGVNQIDLTQGAKTVFNVGTTTNSGVGQGSGHKHQRFTTTAATAASVGAVITEVLTWTSAFADANYTVSCTGDLITSGVPLHGGITAKAAASVTFQTVAATAAAARYTTIDCIADHD